MFDLNEIYQHTPALRDMITPPDLSRMRFGMERFAELEVQARAEGWPSDWRMDHDEREANRQTVMSGRMDRDLWVFAYGSLIWDPAVVVSECRYGTLPGCRRRFCMLTEGGRGTQDRPGLMAALDQGGHCDGIALRIPAELVDRETRFMWRREMFSGSYRPAFLQVSTPQGPVEALAFLMDRTNRRYLADLSEEKAARMIAQASGWTGSNFDYLDSLVRHLDALNIEDDYVSRLHSRSAALLRG